MRRLWVPLFLLQCSIYTSSSTSNSNSSSTSNSSSDDHSLDEHIRVKRDSSEKRVVCYYTNWSVYRPGTAKFTPQNINPYLCTHLIYAFGGLDKENGLRPFDKYQDIEQGGYAKFTGLKSYNKNLKCMLAIGGWNEGSTRFSPLVADEDRRKEFVKNVLKFLRVNHFDGLDLDWEYPAFRDGGKSADRENYAQLVQELRQEFERESDKTGRPRLLLTMAVPAGIEYIDKGYDVKKLNKYLDFMNILSYDYHSAFEPAVNHHSPLYPLEEEGEYNFEAPLSIDHTIKHYIKSGADPNKLVLGIPTYGRSYTLFNPESNQIGAPADGPGEQGDATREKGYLAYYEICGSLKSDDWQIEHPNPRAMGPYAYKGNQWVGYDDQEIAKDKAVYVNEKNLGGIMFWSIDNDDFRGTCHGRPYPIIEAAKEALFGINSELPSSTKPPSSKDSKVSTSTKRTRPKPTQTKSTSVKTTTTPEPATTPEPPTTPDPGSDFKCKDEGFFPHPRDCKKYFWCLDSGPSNLGIVAHQFTCPSGLYFNKGADSCDFARNVLCKIKSPTTPSPSKAPITLATAKTTFNRKEPSTTSTTTTTTTTTTEAPIEEEEEEEPQSEEDPQTIKQLIDLIKKLGGVEELEKQLTKEGKAPISRSLYDRVLANTGSRNTAGRQQNGPGPQNQGIKYTEDETASSSKERPKYKTIQRERPSTTKAPEEDEEVVEEDSVDTSVPATVTPKYQSIFRRRQSTTSSPQDETVEEEVAAEKPAKSKYVTLSRNRPSTGTVAPVREEEEDTPQETTPKYKTLRRPKPKLIDTSSAEDKQSLAEDEEPDTNADEELNNIPSSTTTTTTSRPKEKVKVTRTRVPFTRRPTVSRSTTASTPVSTETTPIRSRFSTTGAAGESQRNGESQGSRAVFRRRRPIGGSSSTSTQAPSTLAQEVNSLPDITTSRSRKFEFPRRSSPSSVNSINSNTLPEPEALQGADYDTQASEELPELANMAVVAIHNLATAPPGSYSSSFSPTVPSTTEKLRRTSIYRQPVNIFSQTQQETQQSTPLRSQPQVTQFLRPSQPEESQFLRPSQPEESQFLRSSQQEESQSFKETPLVRTEFIPAIRGSVSPVEPVSRSTFAPVEQVSRGSFVQVDPGSSRGSFVQADPVNTPSRGSLTPVEPVSRGFLRYPTPQKQKPFTKKLAQRPNTQYDYADDESFGIEPIEIPLSGKVRIHTDGYIECLDMGNFPHPFSCKKFISCAKMENGLNGSLLGWEYTCPKGLSFDPIGGICNWSAGLGCKE